MMNFLTNITGFLWTLNFCLFWPIMQIRKKGDEIKTKSSLKLLSQSQPNFAEKILGCSPFKIVSVSAVLHPRWPPWLKLEISSNGQNCSILDQIKCPNLNCISIMMSFLTYIAGYFMNFELLPILTNYENWKKGGMKQTFICKYYIITLLLCISLLFKI